MALRVLDFCWPSPNDQFPIEKEKLDVQKGERPSTERLRWGIEAGGKGEGREEVV